MNKKKILIIVGVILLGWLMISQPHQAASGVHIALSRLETGANQIIVFVKDVFA